MMRITLNVKGKGYSRANRRCVRIVDRPLHAQQGVHGQLIRQILIALHKQPLAILTRPDYSETMGQPF